MNNSFFFCSQNAFYFVDLRDMAEVAVNALRDFASSGRYTVDNTNEMSDLKSGTSADYAMHKIGIKYSYTIVNTIYLITMLFSRHFLIVLFSIYYFLFLLGITRYWYTRLFIIAIIHRYHWSRNIRNDQSNGRLSLSLTKIEIFFIDNHHL